MYHILWLKLEISLYIYKHVHRCIMPANTQNNPGKINKILVSNYHWACKLRTGGQTEGKEAYFPHVSVLL